MKLNRILNALTDEFPENEIVNIHFTDVNKKKLYFQFDGTTRYWSAEITPAVVLIYAVDKSFYKAITP